MSVADVVRSQMLTTSEVSEVGSETPKIDVLVQPPKEVSSKTSRPNHGPDTRSELSLIQTLALHIDITTEQNTRKTR